MVHSVDPFARVGVASIRLPEYSGWAGAVYGLYYVPLAILAVSLSRWVPLSLPGSDTRTLRFFANPLRSLRLDKNGTAKDAKVSFGTRKITRLALLAQLLAIALIVVHPLSAGRPTGKLRIDFLDVGQGDSALVTFPDNTTLLIDGGGRPGPFQQDSQQDGRPGGIRDEGEEKFERETRSIGESVVSEYLWWRGLDHVDYILATHADADHIDGLNDVARNFAVRAALVARTPDQDPGIRQVFKDSIRTTYSSWHHWRRRCVAVRRRDSERVMAVTFSESKRSFAQQRFDCSSFATWRSRAAAHRRH